MNKTEADELIYKVTHNLRGPLNSLIGLANVAVNDVSDPKSLFYFNKMKESAEKLKSFVDDLLSLTNIKDNHISVENVNFHKIIDEILVSLQYLDNFKFIDFNVNIQQYTNFNTDIPSLYSVLQNIIENSIKYFDSSKPYSFIKIRVNVTDESAKIEIEDNGIGIDQQYIHKITDMFFRASEKSNGNGIGLFIVKKTVERLNGTFNIKSKLGEGTTTSLVFKNSEIK